MFYDSWNVGYALTEWFKPMIELNHFHVLSSGNRNLNDYVNSHEEGDLVAAITSFNPCDIINLGGEHNGDNTNLVTMAFGSRFRINKWIDIGAAYEIPLTNSDETLLKDRILVDAMFTMTF